MGSLNLEEACLISAEEAAEIGLTDMYVLLTCMHDTCLTSAVRGSWWSSCGPIQTGWHTKRKNRRAWISREFAR